MKFQHTKDKVNDLKGQPEQKKTNQFQRMIQGLIFKFFKNVQKSKTYKKVK